MSEAAKRGGCWWARGVTDRFADGDEKDSSIEEAGRTRSAYPRNHGEQKLSNEVPLCQGFGSKHAFDRRWVSSLGVMKFGM